jgi:AraC-like DNA-binding protein
MDVAAGDRLDYWNYRIQDVFPGMSISSNCDIEASWTSRTIGDLRVGCARSQKALVQRWQKKPSEPECRRNIVHLQCSGASLTCQGHDTTLTNAGDMAPCQSAVPYEIHVSDQNAMIVIDFSLDFLSLDYPQGAPCPAQSESVASLRNFALSVLDEDFRDLQGEEDTDEVILNVFSTLIQKCFNDDVAPDGVEVLVSHRVFEFIDNSIQDGALRTNMIANKLSISPKRIQRIFASIGTTPSQYILKKRVNLAALMLRSNAFDGTVTDLAMDAGFSDTAHLCRSFRKFYGMTPTEYAASFRSRN